MCASCACVHWRIKCRYVRCYAQIHAWLELNPPLVQCIDRVKRVHRHTRNIFNICALRAQSSTWSSERWIEILIEHWTFAMKIEMRPYSLFFFLFDIHSPIRPHRGIIYKCLYAFCAHIFNLWMRVNLPHSVGHLYMVRVTRSNDFLLPKMLRFHRKSSSSTLRTVRKIIQYN